MPLDYSTWPTAELNRERNHPTAKAELEKRNANEARHLGWAAVLITPAGFRSTHDGLCGKAPERVWPQPAGSRLTPHRSLATCPDCLVLFDQLVAEGWMFYDRPGIPAADVIDAEDRLWNETVEAFMANARSEVPLLRTPAALTSTAALASTALWAQVIASISGGEKK